CGGIARAGTHHYRGSGFRRARPKGHACTGPEKSEKKGIAMTSLIEVAFDRSRTILSILVFLLVAGSITYIDIPKESSPDAKIPIIYVSMRHEGISPQDSERLLIRPMEQRLRGIEG